MKAGKKVIALAEELSGKCTEGSRILKEVEVEMGDKGSKAISMPVRGMCLSKFMEPGKLMWIQRKWTVQGQRRAAAGERQEAYPGPYI